MILKDPKEKELDKFVMKFLKQRNLLTPVENVVFCEKAFIVASILRYCQREKLQGKMNEKQIAVYFKALYDYEKGALDLFWENGVVKAFKLGDQVNAQKTTEA